MSVVDRDATETAAMSSLTGALVDANDRLLGVLSLITDAAPHTLDRSEMIDALLDRASTVVPLDEVVLDGAVDHCWGTVEPDPSGRWRTALALDDVGEVGVAFARAASRFDTGDTKVMSAVAQLIGNAITTAQVHRQTLTQQLVKSEHATAARITALALPDPAAIPDVPGISIAADLVPARTTGGDLYTWHDVDGDLWFAVGDVSGKGLPAAVVMSTVLNALDAAILRHHARGPHEVIAALDRGVYRRLSDADMFVTLAVGRWQPDRGELALANSGHSPIVFAQSGAVRRIDATAPPVGVVEALTPELERIAVGPEDLLVLATDGITEQVDASGAMFGEDRFDDLVAASRASGDASSIADRLLAAVEAHADGADQSDDRTIVVATFP